MDQPPTERAPVSDALRSKTIVLVGLMGAGKTSVGKRLSVALGLQFRDGDDEIEKSAGLTVPEIFELYGEERFREGERRVMQRLLNAHPHVLATGGGAFMDPQTRATVKEKAVSIWLKADIDVLARRVGRKEGRPLLAGKNAREVLAGLEATRGPVYAQADLIVESGDKPHQATVQAIIDALQELADKAPSRAEEQT